MSGRPGRSCAFSRNRSPARCRKERTASSGLVFLPLMADIIRLRVARSTMSATGQASGLLLVRFAGAGITIGASAVAIAWTTGTATAFPNWRYACVSET